jgi:hypothetical protein
MALPLAGLAGAGCGGPARDQDSERRPAWINAQTAKNNLFLRDFLTRPADWYEFYDGWYPAEQDAKTGSAWRWMEHRGIIRLNVHAGGARQPCDMKLELFGWVPLDHVGFRSAQLEFMVNGHVLGRLAPPDSHPFTHTLVVPAHLLERSDWVDLVITTTNAPHPNGDWRELGFATTGFHWTPVGGT